MVQGACVLTVVLICVPVQVSRQHAKISYNARKNQFEMEVLGKNGVTVNCERLARCRIAVMLELTLLRPGR